MGFSLLPALFLFLASLLNAVFPPGYNLWKVSVVTKEWGHWWAILSLVLAGWLMSRTDWFSGLVALAAAALFALPLAQLLMNQSEWREEIQARIGAREDAPPLFSWKTLFLGRGLKAVAFERIAYDTKDKNQHLDFYRADRKNGPAPLVIVFHGGGWNGGDSEQLPELNWLLSREGIAVASVGYRFAPLNPWPAQQEDALAAIQYLRAHASELNIDMNNYFLLGRSAGAQIAGVVSYTIHDPGLRGYIGFYPPTDMSFGYDVGEEDDLLASRQLLREFLGGTPYEKADTYASASVLEAMKDRPVPTLLLHGWPDRLTWYKHSERLAMRLHVAGVPYAMVLLPWAAHGFDYSLNGPAGQVSTSAIEYFVRERVTPKSALLSR